MVKEGKGKGKERGVAAKTTAKARRSRRRRKRSDQVKIPSSIQGKILHAPTLKFGNDVMLNPIMNREDLSIQPLYCPKRVEHWAILNIESWCDVYEFVLYLQKYARKMGMIIGNTWKYITGTSSTNASSIEKVETLLCQLTSYLPSAPTLVIFVSSSNSSEISDLFHRRCMALGITAHTIDACVSSPKAYLLRELLKINLKVGGINFVSDDINESFSMIFAISMEHLPFKGKQRYVSAVVGTMNRQPMRYKASYTEHQRENEASIPEMIRDVLINLRRNNKERIPERVIIFRSDASQNQSLSELEEIRKVFESFSKFTLVLVKDCEFRFSRDENALQGLVVFPCESKTSSFFINAKDGMAVRYSVLTNEVELKEDLNGFINKLCYMYEGSVEPKSMVAPIRHAKEAASKILRFSHLDDRIKMRVHRNVRDSFFL